MSHLETSEYGGSLGGNEYQAHFAHASAAYEDHDAYSDWEPAEGASGGMQNVGNMERVLSAAAGLGLAAAGLKRGRASGLLLTALGTGLVWRGISGRCQCYAALGINTADRNPAIGVPAQEGYKIERTITVNRPPSELFHFWRHFDNLPRVMKHLKFVETIDDAHSHWKAEGALGTDVEWDAEIINERENELIAWRSLPGGDVDTAGSVHFRPLSHNGGTEMTVSMKYNPPAGKLGAQVASLFGEGLEKKLDDDLARFKEVMETGLPAAPDIASRPDMTPSP
jgi:uncharacterized membrane protein